MNVLIYVWLWKTEPLKGLLLKVHLIRIILKRYAEAVLIMKLLMNNQNQSTLKKTCFFNTKNQGKRNLVFFYAQSSVEVV